MSVYPEPETYLNYDRSALAGTLGVCPQTLPSSLRPTSGGAPHTPKLIYLPLTHEEWEAVSAVLPKLPVPKPDADFKDRIFIDSVLWWIAARARNLSWTYLPLELGPVSSRSHRANRWTMLGYWSEIADKLEADGRLSPDRLRAFRRIAEDAESRKAVLLDRRARLTDASPPVAGSHFKRCLRVNEGPKG